tara:strand:- start:1870 stop:2256 length:387 start_codon:yes stop_codon:yes gene_type:complete
MREIKFRVYDTEKKKLSYGFSIQDLAKEMVQTVIESWVDNLVWQQYTGLKDKNGKDIYEGDILGYFDAIVNNDKERVEIKYWGEQWCEFTIRDYNGKDVKSDEPNDYYGGVSTEYKEVIGNIFEGVDR